MGKEELERGGNCPIRETSRPLSYSALRKLWLEETPDLETRWLSTVFVVNPQRSDACGELAHTLQDLRITSFDSKPVVTGDFPNHDPEAWVPTQLDNMRSAYFVASVRTMQDLKALTGSVKRIRERTGIEHATAVFTHLPSTREDKRKVRVFQEGQIGPYPATEMENVVMLEDVLHGLKGIITRGYVIQAHSPRTYEYAAEIGLPLVPLSPYQEVLAYLKRRGIRFDAEHHRIACPDKGEALMDSFIRDEIRRMWGVDIPKVSFDKTRDPLTGKVKFNELSPADRALIRGKTIWSFDDVGSTFQTGGKMSRVLAEADVEGVMMVCMYADLVGDWERYIEDPVIRHIFYGNSQVPFGNTTAIQNHISSGKLVPVPLGDFVRQVVAADAAGINPFDHPELRRSILMPHEDSLSSVRELKHIPEPYRYAQNG